MEALAMMALLLQLTWSAVVGSFGCVFKRWLALYYFIERYIFHRQSMQTIQHIEEVPVPGT
jgi:hypothetical protein